MADLRRQSDSTTDPSAWVDRHGDTLYRFALSRLRDAEAAEEVVQETFVAALRARDQYSGKGPEGAWLLGICFAISLTAVIPAMVLLSTIPAEAAPPVPWLPVGVARIDITPDEPIRLCGYASRQTESEGVAERIWAKALAIGSDADGPRVILTAELIGVAASLVEPLARRLEQQARTYAR